MNRNKEYENNRGMAWCLPSGFNRILFEKLDSVNSAGYIDESINDPKLWPGAAVVISSNASALDIFNAQEKSFNQSLFMAKDTSSEMSVLKFENPPPMWRLPEQTVFVLTEPDNSCNFDVYAEVGPRRKGPLRNGEQICDNVEPLILVKTSSQWVLMFPSLRGFDSSAAIARSSGLDLQTSTWEVGVIRFLGCLIHDQACSSLIMFQRIPGRNSLETES
jgi:hypothetical protein